MTANQIVTNIKLEALHLLLEEVFYCTNQNIIEKHSRIAEKNSILRHCNSMTFFYNGDFYPQNKSYSTRNPPPLHYSLIDEFVKTSNMLNEAGYEQVKNYFISVLNQSYNRLVLSEMLPVVLCNLLKQRQGKQYDIVDCGYYLDTYREPEHITKANIIKLKEHYNSTLILVKQLLVEKILLT